MASDVPPRHGPRFFAGGFSFSDSEALREGITAGSTMTIEVHADGLAWRYCGVRPEKIPGGYRAELSTAAYVQRVQPEGDQHG